MSKENLKQKIDRIVRDYYTSSKALTLYRNLKGLAYDVAEEVTKELQIPCESCHLSLPQDLIDKNKELQEENKRLIKIEEDYYDFLQKKNEEDWKGDNVVGCLNLRIEQKDKQLTKAKEIIKKLIEAIHIWDCKNLEEVEAEAEQFLNSEVEK
jgi:hypothetical protein